MAIRSHFDPANSLLGWKGFADGSSISNSGGVAIDNTDPYADLKASAAKLGGNAALQYAKNSSVPEFSHIDKTLNKIVMKKPDSFLSSIVGTAPLMENQIYDTDVEMQTELFNHNKLVKELAEAKLLEAKTVEDIAKQKELEESSVFKNQNPLLNINDVHSSDLEDLSLSELEQIKANLGDVKDEVFAGGGDDNLAMGKAQKWWDDFTDKASLKLKPIYENFNITPKPLMSEVDQRIKLIKDTAEVWRQSPGATEYFAANPEAWKAVTTNGSVDNEKFMPWFNSMRGKLSLGNPNSLGVQSRDLWEAFQGAFGGYDKSFFK